MRKALLLATLVVIVIGISSEGSYGESSKIMSYQYRCTSDNQSLYFIMYEQNGRIYGGTMYIENIQAANLSLDSILSEGNLVVRINGNAADVQINLLQDRVIIANSQTHTANQICKCSYVKR